MSDYIPEENQLNLNPLKLVWNIFSFTSGVLGLSSWTSSIIAWKGYFLKIISSYQDIIHPFYFFIFDWIPVEIPSFLIDFLFLGNIYAISNFKSRQKLTFPDGFMKTWDVIPLKNFISNPVTKNRFKRIFLFFASLIRYLIRNTIFFIIILLIDLVHFIAFYIILLPLYILLMSILWLPHLFRDLVFLFLKFSKRLPDKIKPDSERKIISTLLWFGGVLIGFLLAFTVNKFFV